MKLCKLLTLVLVLASVGVAQAQVEVDRHVVAAAGGTTASAGTTVSFTVGQMVVGPTTNNLHDLDIGFWVPAIGGASPVPGTQIPAMFSLDQNYPNPFNPMTVIGFSLPEAGPVNLSIYNLRGERVRLLINEERGAGRHKVTWDGTDSFGLGVSSGTYVARIVSSAGVQNRKMSLAR